MFGQKAARQWASCGSRQVADGEDAGLLHFAQEGGLGFQLAGDGQGQHHFIDAVGRDIGLGVHVQLDVRLPLFLEDVRGIRGFEGTSLV